MYQLRKYFQCFYQYEIAWLRLEFVNEKQPGKSQD